jgi:putative ABC transport system permease protein
MRSGSRGQYEFQIPNSKFLITGFTITLRHAIRVLLKSPGFNGVIIAVLAVGIGATTAIFTIVNGVLLKRLPFADASRLVAVRSVLPGEEGGSASFPDFTDWRANAKAFDAMAAYTGNDVTMTGRGDPVSLPIAATSSGLFTVLDVKPLAGRVLDARDDRPGAEPVAVISEAMWEHRFDRRSTIVGEPVTLDGRRFTIVGVMPAAFEFPIQAERVEAWLPLRSTPFLSEFLEQRAAHFMQVVGRLAPGATLAGANAELAKMSADLAAAYPKSNAKRTATGRSLLDELVQQYRLGLVVLLLASAAVLLIACANVANLLLARAAARQREIAIRMAIGAGRGQLVRQLLTESAMLSLAAGALGVVVAHWALTGLTAVSPINVPRLHGVVIDRSALLFTLLVAMATGMLFGLAPALHLARANSSDVLKDGRGGSGPHSARMRHALVVGEVALSLVLLSSAGLLIRSLTALQHVNPGFVAEHALAAELQLPKTRYAGAASQITFYQRLLEQLHAVPASRETMSSALVTTLPLSGNDLGLGFTIDGRPTDPGNRPTAAYFAISPEYFRAMGIRILKGRPFTERDDQSAARVVIISEALARRYWPDEEPIGKHLTIGYNQGGPSEIVGVVADVKQVDLSEKVRPALYTPYPQTPWPFMAAIVRTTGDPAAAAGAIRAAVTATDPEQPVGRIQAVTEYVDRAVATPRFTAALVGSFASIAVVLAGFGLFSVMAYSVASRRRELGIRLALGAQAADVRRLVMAEAARLGGIGLALGLAGAVAASRVFESLLFGITPSDPVTFGGVSATLFAVLAFAAYLPARRAARIDPMRALRSE